MFADRNDGIFQLQLLTDRQKLLVFDHHHNPWNPQIFGNQTGDNIGLIMLCDAVQDLSPCRINFLEHNGLASATVKKCAVKSLAQLLNTV